MSQMSAAMGQQQDAQHYTVRIPAFPLDRAFGF